MPSLLDTPADKRGKGRRRKLLDVGAMRKAAASQIRRMADSAAKSISQCVLSCSCSKHAVHDVPFALSDGPYLWSSLFHCCTVSILLQRCRIPLRLKVRISSIDGTMLAWLPPPPGDRLWSAFTSLRELNLTAKPVVRTVLQNR